MVAIAPVGRFETLEYYWYLRYDMLCLIESRMSADYWHPAGPYD